MSSLVFAASQMFILRCLWRMRCAGDWLGWFNIPTKSLNSASLWKIFNGKEYVFKKRKKKRPKVRRWLWIFSCSLCLYSAGRIILVLYTWSHDDTAAQATCRVDTGSRNFALRTRMNWRNKILYRFYCHGAQGKLCPNGQKKLIKAWPGSQLTCAARSWSAGLPPLIKTSSSLSHSHQWNYLPPQTIMLQIIGLRRANAKQEYSF